MYVSICIIIFKSSQKNIGVKANIDNHNYALQHVEKCFRNTCIRNVNQKKALEKVNKILSSTYIKNLNKMIVLLQEL